MWPKSVVVVEEETQLKGGFIACLLHLSDLPSQAVELTIPS
jgi:hypothetical protein